jgi:CRP-like cAMP-binding protein
VLEPGEVVFEHGSASDLVYVVNEGQVALVREHADRTEGNPAVSRPGRVLR